MEPSTLQIYRETVKKLSKATHPKKQNYSLLLNYSQENQQLQFLKLLIKKKKEKNVYFHPKINNTSFLVL